MQSIVALFRHHFLGVYCFFADIFEYGRVVWRYYRNFRFALTDLYLQLNYLISNPYRVCRHFIEDLPDSQVQKIYGETSLTSFEKILKAADIKPTETLYELGCGRGRLVFWASQWLDINAVGIDINPTFIKRAQRVKRWTKAKKASFQCANIMTCQLDAADVIYLYGSAFEEPSWVNIKKLLLTTKKGATIITVSWPLSEITDEYSYQLVKEISCEFLWGTAQVYIQKKR